MIKDRESPLFATTLRKRRTLPNEKRERHLFRMVRFYILFCIIFCQKQKYKSSNTHLKVVLPERKTRFGFFLLSSWRSKKKIPFDIFCVEMQLRGGKRKREENELEKEEKVKENEIQGETRRIKKGELDEKTVGEGFRCGICFEIMSWERSPRVLPCGHSFCSECLSKLLHIQQQQQQPQTPPSSSLHGDSDVPPHFPEPQIPHRLSRTTPPTHLIDKRVTLPTPLSSSSTSSSSSSISFSFSFSSGEVGTSSVGKGNCPFCRSVIECKSIESLPHNYLIPETIDVLLSSQVLSLDHSPGLSFELFFSPFSLSLIFFSIS